ncbi:MAG: FAD-dependent oxidoreductase, partial [Bacteroidota bacterium]
VTPISWLGGMLTAAGVSATDGNHQLPAGMWGEFRDSLRDYYGGADSLFTGWVSNTMFEPKIGDYYWKQIAQKEPNLTILYNTKFTTLVREYGFWTGHFEDKNGVKKITAKVVIDGTDLGDVAVKAGATFDVGMDSRAKTGETMAPEKANNIIQDLTYAAILKDYGKGTDKTIPKPNPYDPSQFYCACQQNCDDETAKPHPCETMLNYGELPNGKYMINWPLKGNDYYANMVEQTTEERATTIKKAKNKTLQFIYYIQTELGYKNLGLAVDEFPTADNFPLMPYHREGRRIHGLVQLNVNHILNPYDYTLYRTGVAVGDYPIDHHHYEYPDAPEIDFPKVPSFSIPLGALIPKNVDNLLVADKAISVTNIVNGSSRLQPVIVQIGQVAGLVGAIAAQSQQSPKDLNVRLVQQKILDFQGYLLPFIDVKPNHPHFQAIQKVAATGLLKGTGVPYKWANQTWFYPDSTILTADFYQNVKDYDGRFKWKAPADETLTILTTIDLLFEWITAEYGELYGDKNKFTQKVEKEWGMKNFTINRPVTRAELAVLLDQYIHPFKRKVNMKGNWIN